MDEENKFDLKLIKLIEKHDCLYNRESINFKNPHVKQNSWTEIANDLGETVSYCEKRWYALRARFSKEKRSMKESKILGSTYIIDWPLYKNMRFLSKFVRSRNIFNGSAYDFTNEAMNSVPESTSNNGESSGLPNAYEIKKEIVERANNEVETIEIRDEGERKPAKRKKEYIGEETSNRLGAIEANLEVLTDHFLKTNKKDKDPDFAFANMIYTHLRAIDDRQKRMRVKSRIMDCFL